MKLTRIIPILCLSSLLLASCEKPPKACLDLPPTLEADAFITLESCSEDYEFLTWEYSDEIGNVSDVSQRKFEFESEYAVTVTAYSDGAFQSDEATQTFKTSYRYTDFVELTGNLNYDKIVITGVGFIEEENVQGNYTEENPFVISYYDAGGRGRFEPSPTVIEVTGFQGEAEVLKFSKRFNFDSFKENPVSLENADGSVTATVYWRYR